MDLPSTWLSQQDVQDHGFMNQYQMLADISIDSFSSESNSKNNQSFEDQGFKLTNNIIINKHAPANENPSPKPKALPPDNHIPNSFTISFGDLKPEDEIQLPAYSDSFDYPNCTKRGPIMIRNSIQLRDHMLAERKRREKLAQRFISLSSLLPGLKKFDKATVLEDATNYILELQCRVKELEGLSNIKMKKLQSVVKRSKLSCSDDNDSSYDEANINGDNSSPCEPEVEVRMSSGSVLVRIYCQRNYMILAKALNKMPKLGLCVTSSSALPFANAFLLITIVAKKNEDFSMSTSTDLVKNLQLAIS